jgi:hypothetical protein
VGDVLTDRFPGYYLVHQALCDCFSVVPEKPLQSDQKLKLVGVLLSPIPLLTVNQQTVEVQCSFVSSLR